MFGQSKLPNVFAASEEGFADASFRIISSKVSIGRTRSFKIRALFNEKKVGIIVQLSSDWTPDTIGDGIPVLWGQVRYKSLGSESDAFLQALASAYGVRLPESTMASTIDFSAVALHGNPMTFESGRVDMKLFYESGTEGSHAEIYTNLDTDTLEAEIREKDTGFRKPILQALMRVK